MELPAPACWRALFSPAFWLATPSGRSFPPAVGHAAARDAVISNDLNEGPLRGGFLRATAPQPCGLALKCHHVFCSVPNKRSNATREY
jgi:hypothetical protein